MALNIPTLTDFPPPPSVNDSINFRTKAVNHVTHLGTVFTPEMNAIVDELNLITSGFDQVEPIAEWVVGTTYNFPTSVAGSNGHTYRCVSTNVTGVDPISDNGTNWLQTSGGAEALIEINATKVTASATYTVGATGDYATVEAALIALAHRRVHYTQAGIEVTLELQNGYVFTKPIIVRGLNLGWIKITAAGTVTINRASLTVPVSGYYPAFAALNGAVLPKIAAVFQINTSGSSTSRAFLLCDAARAEVLDSAGCNGPLADGIVSINGGAVSTSRCILTGITANGMVASFGGCIVAFRANVSGCNVGFSSSYGGSIVSHFADCTNCTNSGAIAFSGGNIIAISANASGAGIVGFNVSSGGIIAASGSTGTLSQNANTLTANGIIFK